MTSPDYQKGYRAGRARRRREVSAEHKAAADQAMLDRLFVAALPAAMSAEGWTIGDKKVHTTLDRAELARRWALSAMRKRPQLWEI